MGKELKTAMACPGSLKVIASILRLYKCRASLPCLQLAPCTLLACPCMQLGALILVECQQYDPFWPMLCTCYPHVDRHFIGCHAQILPSFSNCADRRCGNVLQLSWQMAGTSRGLQPAWRRCTLNGLFDLQLLTFLVCRIAMLASAGILAAEITGHGPWCAFCNCTSMPSHSSVQGGQASN